MLNNTLSRPLSGYHDARIRRRQLYRRVVKSRKHAKQRSFKEQCFPFHRLPREIIAEIFVLCLPDFEDVFDSLKSKTAAPLLLCNICSSWRSLALSIPNLWNKIFIRVADPQVDKDFSTSMAESWIARSGELPLSLRLYANPWSEEGQAEAMAKAYLNTFFRYALRWESVVINLFDCSTLSFPKFGPTPLLRKFSHSTSSPIPFSFPFTSSPLLSSITWPFMGSTRDPDIPWHQLTHLTLEHIMSTHQTLDILRTCQTLVQLNVELDDLSLDSVRPCRKPVEHLNLRSFQIYTYQTCSTLLRRLTLPALTDLSLNTDYDSLSFTSPHSVHKQLLRLFTRSKCKLEKFRLGNCGFDDACILTCLIHDSCSSLTDLEIANNFIRPMFTDLVILALTDKDGLSEVNDVILPNLSRLSLEMCLFASSGLLGLMVITRCLWWDKDDQLKSLSLTVRDFPDDLDDALLKVAKEMGVEVEITIDQYTDSEDLSDTDDGYGSL